MELMKVILHYTIFEKYNITVAKVIQLAVVLGGLSCVFNLYLHTYKKKGLKNMLIIFLDNCPFYSVLIIPILYIIFSLDFYQDYKWLILCNSCLIFARVTIDIQIKIVTMDTIRCNFMVLFSNMAYISSLLIPWKFNKYYGLLILMSLQISELSAFIYYRTKQITNYLNIRIFCVNTFIPHSPQILSTS